LSTRLPLVTASGRLLRLGRLFGKGGEAEIFHVDDDAAIAVKLYTDGKEVERLPKVRAMIADKMNEKTSLVAFPLETVLSNGRFVGFTMRSTLFLREALCFFSCPSSYWQRSPSNWVQRGRSCSGRAASASTEPFQLLKFRTMSVLEDGDVADTNGARRDPRVTRIGRFLRETSFDELPQLIDVLRGEMSIVGPRPHALSRDDYSVISDYAFRHHVKPGMTGWAQVNGYRGETPNAEAKSRRIAYDLWYINHWSAWFDLTIVLRAALAVFGANFETAAPLPARNWDTFRTPDVPPARAKLTGFSFADFNSARLREDSVKPPSNLFVGNHRYPLRSTAVPQYDGSVMRLGYLAASGPTRNAALDSISRRLHRDFQRIWLCIGSP
jgi:hypothetical protein